MWANPNFLNASTWTGSVISQLSDVNALTFTEGLDGSPVTEALYAQNYSAFEDTDAISISFLTDGGYGNIAKSAAVVSAVNRDDTVVIGSSPVTVSKGEDLLAWAQALPAFLNDTYFMTYGGVN